LGIEAALAKSVRVTARVLVVDLRDGRTVSVPLHWYPRLLHGSPRERERWELIGPGVGIHWPSLDEDISVEDLLHGRASGERDASFQRWLHSRRRPANTRLKPTKAHRRGSATRVPRRRLRG
jgi:hypothetical protein